VKALLIPFATDTTSDVTPVAIDEIPEKNDCPKDNKNDMFTPLLHLLLKLEYIT